MGNIHRKMRKKESTNDEAYAALEETKTERRGCLTATLRGVDEEAFNTWRDHVLGTLPDELLSCLQKPLPKPHITLMYDCSPAREAVLQAVPARCFMFRAHCVHAGTVSPALLLRLTSPSMVSAFHTLHGDAGANPKGVAYTHALFDYAKSKDNRLGYIPHLTLGWFDEDVNRDALRTFAAGIDEYPFSDVPTVTQGLMFKS